MSNLPAFNGRQFIKILKKFGFEIIRIKGSHHFLKHADGRVTVIPVHEKKLSELVYFTKF